MDNNRPFKYWVLDVFTDQKYTGNPLAVIRTDGDLPAEAYGRIAQEFGYSETSFLTYIEYENVLKIRSFTPTGIEVGGAGHNLLGAVCMVMQTLPDLLLSPIQPVVIMMDTPIKLLIGDGTVSMVQQPAVIGATVPRGALAEALALTMEDLGQGELVPTMVSTEVNHLMVPLKDSDALDRAWADKGKLAGLSAEFGFEGVYCFVLAEEGSTYMAQARFFNPGIGIIEDPATGSAAGPLGGFLHHYGRIEIEKEYQILQGSGMGRPSVLKLKVMDEGILISGNAVIVMEGILYYDLPN